MQLFHIHWAKKTALNRFGPKSIEYIYQLLYWWGAAWFTWRKPFKIGHRSLLSLSSQSQFLFIEIEIFLQLFAIRDLFVLFLPVVASVELRKSSENSWLCHSFTSHSLCPFAPYHGLVLSFLFCCRDLQWRVPWGMNRQGLKHFHGGVFLDNGLAVCSLDLVY